MDFYPRAVNEIIKRLIDSGLTQEEAMELFSEMLDELQDPRSYKSQEEESETIH